jgi:methylthioribose-1-phosphate isomerase
MSGDTNVLTSPLDPVRWDDNAVRIIDQRLLPERLEYRHCRDVEAVAEAIETLAVRGAPALSIAAAYGVAVAAQNAEEPGEDSRKAARLAIDRLRATRPTAVNLFHALDRMEGVLDRLPPRETTPLGKALLEEADRILEEDLDSGSRIAEAGLGLFPDREPVRVLTHCNAGGLATGGWGTALAPIYAACARGRQLHVLADETRPLLQGSRLTAWEMSRAGIPVSVLVDGAAASVLRRGDVDLVIVGADRVVANGDTANKIGTYAVALAAREAGVPFYVAAPVSTFDLDIASGDKIPVEERSGSEVLGPSPPDGVDALNPAFDVTPAGMITGWITDRGVLEPPFTAQKLGKQKPDS